MQKEDPMTAQAPQNNEEETEPFVSEEVDQAVAPPVSATFATSTIDIRLQIQPEDGHLQGRRIRNVISVNGKILRVGALRANQLNALIVLLQELEMDQAMECFAQFLAMLSERQAATLCKTGASSTQPAVSQERSSPAVAVQTPLLEASPASIQEEKLKEPGQGEPVCVTTGPEKVVTEPTTLPSVPPVAPASMPKKEALSPKAKPEQLALF